MRARLILLFLLFTAAVAAQIQSGPMLGYCEMTEAMIWIQLEKPGQVKLTYWPTNTPKNAQGVRATVNVEDANVAHLKLMDLEPGTSYSYSITVDEKWIELSYPLKFETQALWQHRANPPDFTMLTGSCHYANERDMDRPGEPYGKSSEIFDAMADKEPDLMLWLGDNIYLREPDWSTRNGFLHRYTHTRSEERLQRFLATCPHYAIWDDHDFGPNDANGSFIHKDWALEAFKLFWANPSYGLTDVPGSMGQFRFNDIDFFLLDNRTYRVDYQMQTVEHQILGQAQIDWLIQALKFSDASFKIVAIGGQVLNSASIYENYANYPAERDSLLARLEREKIKNVIFLTGDRHHTELSKMERDSLVFYDLTISPLTSRAYSYDQEDNAYRVPETGVSTQNFGALSFSGPAKRRKLMITVFDDEGKELWTREIQRQE